MFRPGYLSAKHNSLSILLKFSYTPLALLRYTYEKAPKRWPKTCKAKGIDQKAAPFRAF